MVHRTLTEAAGAIALGIERTIPASVARWWQMFGAHAQQYGGRTFALASRFLSRARRDAGAAARLRCAADARGVAASATMLSRLPRISISLTDSPSGRAIREHLAERRFGIHKHRIAQGVLTLPDSFDEYLRGRSRQALRTNIRHARTLGIRCQRLADRSQRRAYADLLDPDLTDPWKREQLLARPEAACWIALDADDQPIGLAVLSIDGDVSMLWSLVCHDSPGRWLLHAQIVEMLAAEGVRHLLVAAPMAPLLPPGIQYFQRLLGYRVVHVSCGAQAR